MEDLSYSMSVKDTELIVKHLLTKKTKSPVALLLNSIRYQRKKLNKVHEHF
jgi:hypothetical protein